MLQCPPQTSQKSGRISLKGAPPTKRGRISFIWRNPTCMSFVLPQKIFGAPNRLAKNPPRVETHTTKNTPPPWLASKDAFNVFKVRLTTEGWPVGMIFRPDRFWGSGRLFWGGYGKLEKKHQVKTRRTLGGKGNDEHFLTIIYTNWKLKMGYMNYLNSKEEIIQLQISSSYIQL